MPTRCLFLLAISLFICIDATCQISTNSFRLSESLLESLVSLGAGPEDIENMLEELEYLQKNPLDLNTCSREDLEKLPFLTGFQVNSLLEYRNEKGPMLSVYELQVIHGFSRDVIEMVLPFVYVPDRSDPGALSLRGAGKYGRHEVEVRTQRVFEKSRGYSAIDPVTGKSRYPGSPWYLNARYGFIYRNNLRAGITLEKDPGEDMFRSSNRHGFDFNSAFILVNNTGYVKSAIAGDYRLAFGQGLTLWSGTSPGKSSEPLSIVKRQDVLKAFTSNDENNYFRGVAATTGLGKFTLTAFFSSKKRDANITDTLENGRVYFSSFQESGYHRTSSEITDEKAVRETVIGANLNFRNNFMKIGSTLVSYRFDKYLEKGDEPRELYNFSGNKLFNVGIDYTMTFKKIQLFGETSYGNDRLATLNGILVNANKYASFSLLYRNFAPGYFSLNSSAFSEGSDDSNEEGIYAGIILRPFARFKISGYADFYRFPWLRYGLSKPAGGSDFLLQADYRASGKVDMYLRLKYEFDPENELPGSSLIPDVVEVHNSGLRYHIRYTVSTGLVMQNRVEMTRSGNSHGFLLYHDVAYRLKKIPVELDFRLAWFNTDDYDSRIYAYEQDMTAGFSFSPLYDKGMRGYIMATFNIGPDIKAGIRYCSTRYFNRETIGSGNDVIEGNSKNDIKIRVTVRF